MGAERRSEAVAAVVLGYAVGAQLFAAALGAASDVSKVRAHSRAAARFAVDFAVPARCFVVSLWWLWWRRWFWLFVWSGVLFTLPAVHGHAVVNANHVAKIVGWLCNVAEWAFFHGELVLTAHGLLGGMLSVVGFMEAKKNKKKRMLECVY